MGCRRGSVYNPQLTIRVAWRIGPGEAGVCSTVYLTPPRVDPVRRRRYHDNVTVVDRGAFCAPERGHVRDRAPYQLKSSRKAAKPCAIASVLGSEAHG
jgi:hypothetical protein